jgi:hypothetical protein
MPSGQDLADIKHYNIGKKDIASTGKKAINDALPKLLSNKRGLNLTLKVEIDGAIQEIKFPEIKAAPKLRYAVNYGHGQTVEGNGDWVVSQRKQAAADKTGVLIAKARANPTGTKPLKAPNTADWSRFRCQDNTRPDGIPLEDFKNKVSKWTYFVRTAPTEPVRDDEGRIISGEYRAAGKTARLSVTSVRKVPNLKPKNGTVKTKKGMMYNFNPTLIIDGVPIENPPDPVRNRKTSSETITLLDGRYEFWFEGGKKAPSMKQDIGG